MSKTVFESMGTTGEEEQHAGYPKQSFGMVDMELRTINLVSDYDSEEEEQKEEEEQEQKEEEAVPQIEASGASELTVTQILEIVPRVKRGNKKTVQPSALDIGTIAQIENQHKRLHVPLGLSTPSATPCAREASALRGACERVAKMHTCTCTCKM